ncbi:MAG: chitinase [Clostridia bacterium]|nr:chitinase [Clostridia bacterium]
MKILGYVGDRDLPDVTREDALMLDTINIAFGHVGKDSALETKGIRHTDELSRIRSYNPDIKFVLSVGGWGAGGFSIMSRTQEGRSIFAESCAGYAFAHGLDGIDIDWEYPCNDSANIDAHPSDKQNYTLLLDELRKALGQEKIVSIAAGAGRYFVRDTEMDKVADICSYVQLMTYDMRSGFCRQSGHHTAPFASKGDDSGLDTRSITEMFISAGVPAEKIVIGVAFYSRRWDGVPNVNHGLLQKAATTGNYGPGYTELVNNWINKNGFTRYFDEDAKAPFLFNGESLISYDDPESVTAKCEYLKHAGLMGIMYWEHKCDSERVLLKTMHACR